MRSGMMQLGENAKVSQHGAQHECGAARPRCTEARAGQRCGRGHAGASAASAIKGCLSLSTSDYESGGQEFESLRARQYLVPTQLLILQPVSGVVAPPSPSTRARRVARGSLCRKDMSLIFMSRITPALQPPVGYVAPQVA